MPLQHYRELIAWQKAMDLTEAVYALTRRFPRDEQFGLTIQLRRSAVSVPSNIAEGQGRGSTKEFVQFLRIAGASLQEAETQLLLGSRFGYIADDELQDVLARSAEVARIINGLVRKLVARS